MNDIDTDTTLTQSWTSLLDECTGDKLCSGAAVVIYGGCHRSNEQLQLQHACILTQMFSFSLAYELAGYKNQSQVPFEF